MTRSRCISRIDPSLIRPRKTPEALLLECKLSIRPKTDKQLEAEYDMKIRRMWFPEPCGGFGA